MSSSARNIQIASERPVVRLAVLPPVKKKPKDDLYDETYPASWFHVAPSHRVKKGDKLSVDAFGRRLVVWRGSSGEARVQQRFCPHMGASLARGDVQGDRIVCPFHRWEYGGDGACKNIPYMEKKKIPKRAQLETFPVVEHSGAIWAFNGAEPTHDLPPLTEFGAKGFGARSRTQRFENTHPLLILENGCDAQHFKYVHKVEFEKYEVNVTEDTEHGFAFDVLQTIRGPRGTSSFTITTSIAYVGASLIYGRLSRNDSLMASFIAAPTPIAANKTDFTLIVAVKSLPWFISFLNPLYYSLLARQLFTGATDDYFPIWKEMDPSYRGVLVEEDRLQQRFRKYYRAHLPSVAEVG